MQTRQEAETHLLEAMISALDTRESARRGGSSMLVYLADMTVQRIKDELDALKNDPIGGSPHMSATA